MRKVSPIGNSLAYLLTQKQKPVPADVHLVSKKMSLTGNSLAYLLSQKQ
jgi:hypothetical protein